MRTRTQRPRHAGGAVGGATGHLQRNTSLQTHLDGVDQVLDQEHASQVTDGLVELGQNHVAVLVDHVFRQRHLLVQILPAGHSRGQHCKDMLQFL